MSEYAGAWARVARMALCLASVLPVPVAGQEQDLVPQFRSRVELVRVQVAVHRDDEFVGGLTTADFTLTVDDLEREIAWVTETGVAPIDVATSSPAAEVAAPVRRQFVFVLDALFQRPEKLEICKRAVREFLDTMHRPGDVMALAAIGYRGVSLLAPFTSDPDFIRQRLEMINTDWTWQIARAVARGGRELWDSREFPAAPRRPRGVPPGFELLPGILPMQNLDGVNMVGLYLAGMNELAVALQAVEGRKHLLLYSRGLSSYMIGLSGMPSVSIRAPTGVIDRVSDVEYTAYSLRSLFMMMTESMRDADAAVHSFSTARAPSSLRGNRFGMHSLWYLKDETQGSMSFHTHHLEDATAKVNERTLRYYTLAYRRSPLDPDRVSIEIGVNRDDAKIDAPTRLVLPPEVHEMTPLQQRMYEAERAAVAASSPGS